MQQARRRQAGKLADCLARSAISLAARLAEQSEPLNDAVVNELTEVYLEKEMENERSLLV